MLFIEDPPECCFHNLSKFPKLEPLSFCKKRPEQCFGLFTDDALVLEIDNWSHEIEGLKLEPGPITRICC